MINRNVQPWLTTPLEHNRDERGVACPLRCSSPNRSFQRTKGQSAAGTGDITYEQSSSQLSHGQLTTTVDCGWLIIGEKWGKHCTQSPLINESSTRL